MYTPLTLFPKAFSLGSNTPIFYSSCLPVVWTVWRNFLNTTVDDRDRGKGKRKHCFHSCYMPQQMRVHISSPFLPWNNKLARVRYSKLVGNAQCRHTHVSSSFFVWYSMRLQTTMFHCRRRATSSLTSIMHIIPAISAEIYLTSVPWQGCSCGWGGTEFHSTVNRGVR